MPTHQRWDVRAFAPPVWDAVCDLLGGEERIASPYTWGDGLIVNLREGADRPWDPPSPRVKGWHKDGDFFRHFLDSPEQGLLTLVLWTDVLPRGGATFVAADSVPVVARFLAERPEGVLPQEFPRQELIAQCHDFVEATGEKSAGSGRLKSSGVRSWTGGLVIIRGRPSRFCDLACST